jgi:hypothetical protein
MVKVISLFLLGMAVLALFGRLRLPFGRGGSTRRLAASRCDRCGKPKIGAGPCDCRTRP